MLKNYSKVILILLSLLSIIVGLGGCKYRLHELSTPKPISKTNVPLQFNIIGFTENNKPVLLQYDISMRNLLKYYKSDSKLEKDCGIKIIRSKDCKNSKKYSFYIDIRKKGYIERTLTAEQNDSLKSISVKILENDSISKKQKIYVDYCDDDFNYYSIYEVNNHSVTPLEYGDLIKADGFKAVCYGLLYMLSFYIFGRIVFAIVLHYESKHMIK